MLAPAALLALLAALPAAPPAALCAQARAPLRREASGVSPGARKTIEAYRRAWRTACDPDGERVDLGALLGDAEALVQDVKLAPALRALAEPAGAGAGAWPYPGILPGEELALDWSAFAGAAERGNADDERFWRGAAVVAGAQGGPAWMAPDPGREGEECVRLGAVSWRDVADALGEMESVSAPAYLAHARRLRDDLETALDAVKEGPAVCGCTKGDPLAGLDALAVVAAQRGTPERRSLARLAGEAAAALRTGRTRVVWSQEGPDAPPTGCAVLR